MHVLPPGWLDITSHVICTGLPVITHTQFCARKGGTVGCRTEKAFCFYNLIQSPTSGLVLACHLYTTLWNCQFRVYSTHVPHIDQEGWEMQELPWLYQGHVTKQN